MNLRGEITTDWADGTYTFRLTVAGAIELEQKCDAPIAVISARLQSGAYRVSDLRETIRLGLIGGGKSPVEALTVVRNYVDERPLAESWAVARLVMGGLMFGFEEAPLGKAEAAPTTAPEPPPASTPQPFIRPSPFSDIEDLMQPI